MDLWERLRNKAGRCRDFLADRFLYMCLNYSQDATEGRPQNLFQRFGLRFVLRGRKLVAFYGECHVYTYRDFLRQSRELKKRYVLLGAKELPYLARYHAKYIERRAIWDKLDVLIYNPGAPDRKGIPPLHDVLSWLPEGAQRIEVTNAVFKGYFPQHTERVFPNNGYFCYGDKNLNHLLMDGNTTESAVGHLFDEDYYTADFVTSFFDKNIKMMKQYEERCTVRIADYVEEHGKKRVLYYSVTHPVMEVMREISRRILLELGVQMSIGRRSGGAQGEVELSSHAEAVYPSVYKGLGITEGRWEDRRFQPGNYRDQSYTFREYVKEYLRMGKQAAETA